MQQHQRFDLSSIIHIRNCVLQILGRGAKGEHPQHLMDDLAILAVRLEAMQQKEPLVINTVALCDSCRQQIDTLQESPTQLMEWCSATHDTLLDDEVTNDTMESFRDDDQRHLRGHIFRIGHHYDAMKRHLRNYIASYGNDEFAQSIAAFIAENDTTASPDDENDED